LLTYDHRCSGCRACTLACSIANYGEITTAKAALYIEGRFPAPGVYHIRVCDHCGNCANACPEAAIVWQKTKLVLRKEDCTECNICFEACPKQVLRPNPDNGQPILCTACGQCVAICPRNAIAMLPDAPNEVNP
jgi:Fe-S-cluster-containing hydrogenase component 2